MKKQDDDKRITNAELLAKGIAKASSLSADAAIAAIDTTQKKWGELKAIDAKYDPEALQRFVEITGHLQPCIDSMAVNIDGYGHAFTYVAPWMSNLDTDAATEAIRECLTVEAMQQADDEQLLAKAGLGEPNKKASGRKSNDATKALLGQPEPGDEEAIINSKIETEKKRLSKEITREKYVFDSFFARCCSDSSFIKLRRKVRADIETHGWGCIEMIRDNLGILKRLAYVPGYTVRPMEQLPEVVSVKEDDSVTPLSVNRTIIVKRFFRIYIQRVGTSVVYFKSPQDPRIISRNTARIYDSIEALRAPKDAKIPGEGEGAEQAGELIYLSLHSASSACPPPRWTGNLLAALSTREADEANYFYLRDNAIPAGIIFVHGGTIAKDAKQRIEARMKAEMRGSENTGKLLIIEANPGQLSPTGDRATMPSITYQSLRDSQSNDATFTNLDARAADRIGASFRLSPMLRGYTPNTLNRATAYAAVDFAEQQVFQPERDDFDWMVNAIILPAINIKHLRFRSNSPPTRSADDVCAVINAAGPQGGLAPNDVRDMLSDVMNRKFTPVTEPWGEQPIALTLAGGGNALKPDPAVIEMNQRLRKIEVKAASIVRNELAASGMIIDDVRARFIDDPKNGETNGTEDQH